MAEGGSPSRGNINIDLKWHWNNDDEYKSDNESNISYHYDKKFV